MNLMNRSKRGLLSAISLLLVLLLVGCTGEPPVTSGETSADETTAGETTAEEGTTGGTTPPDTLNLIGGETFKVLRSEYASQKCVQLCADFFAAIKKESGAKFEISGDFLYKDETPDEEAFEILYGNTNRAASGRAQEKVSGKYDYYVAVDGNKVVLAGGSDFALGRAGEIFLDYCKEVNFAIPRDLSLSGQVELSPYVVGITNQGENKIDVYDVGAGGIDDSTLLWSREYPVYNIAGVKLRRYKGKEVVLAAYGKTYANMVSFDEEKTVLWQTGQAASNPHSIELIPFENDEYLIAVASTTGAELRFYEPTDASGTPLLAFPVADGHGVLWDPEGNCLWLWGSNQLLKLKVAKNGRTVTVTTEATYTSPTTGGHDLAPVYGDTNLLWLSTSSKVYQFNKTTGEFSVDYDAKNVLCTSAVKGVGNFPDGSVVRISPDGIFKAHTGRSIVFGQRDAETGRFRSTTYTSPTGHFYKVRVWSADYQ